MADDGRRTVLHRKIDRAATRLARASLQDALLHDVRKALAKVFLQLLALEVEIDIRDSRVAFSGALTAKMQTQLFGIVALPGGTGIAGIDHRFVNTLSCRFSGGTPPTETAIENRGFTHTDCNLATVLLDRFLHEAFTIPAGTDTKAFGICRYERTTAPLAYILDDQKLAFLSVSIRAADGGALGNLEILLPWECAAAFARHDTAPTPDTAGNLWKQQMQDIAATTPLRLTAVVQRLSLSLEGILALHAGGILTLPDASLKRISFEIPTVAGPLELCVGQLGSLNNNKAFRVTKVP